MTLTREELLDAYGTMCLIRAFEETIRRLHSEGKLPGFMHVSVWQEAVPTGVSMRLREDDLIASTHRGHGDMIAKGADPERMLAEIYAKSEGLCRGKGGSMHVADVSKGALGANGIVGAGMPIGVGAALAHKRQGLDRVTVVYTGDGAVANGSTHESLNMAALWRLPVLFVRVNNQYAESTPTADYLAIPDVVAYATTYGIAAERVDGMDVEAVADAAGRAVARARADEGATFLECETYRRYGHNIGDTGSWRPAEEVERWQVREPIARARQRLVSAHGVDEEALEGIAAAAEERMARAVEWAEHLPDPPPEWAFEDVCGDSGIREALRLP